MKKVFLLQTFTFFVLIASYQPRCYGQKNGPSSWDPALESNSEKWELKRSRKIFGDIKRLEFGPYAVLSIEKLDSPVVKKKTKGGSEFQLFLGYDAEQRNGKNVAFDVTRKVTVEKTKFYRVLQANNTDTIEILFSIASGSTEERQTALGIILNGSNDNSSPVVGTAVDKKGFIITNADSTPWSFSYQSISNKSFEKPRLSGYLKNNTDSFFVKPIIGMSEIRFNPFRKADRDTTYNIKGIVLINQKGEQIAAYQYPQSPPMSAQDTKSFIWMRKDLDNTSRQAISSYWAAIIVL